MRAMLRRGVGKSASRGLMGDCTGVSEGGWGRTSRLSGGGGGGSQGISWTGKQVGVRIWNCGRLSGGGELFRELAWSQRPVPRG